MTTPIDANRYAVHADSRFESHHGATCARADKAVSTDNGGGAVYGIGVEDSIAFPPGFDDGTVFMNGWRLRYADGDHQVFALSSAIVDIEKRDGELRWKAGGVLSDKNGDDAYYWCYHYTVLFWKSDALDTRLGFDIKATIDDSDEGADLTFLSYDSGDPLRSYRSTANVGPDLLPNATAVVLPRGFGMMWERVYAGTPLQGEFRDHPLLQFSMKHGDGQLVYVDDGLSNLHWSHQSVFRDKNTDDDYAASQVVSIIHGQGVGHQQSDLRIFDSPELGQPTGTREIFSDTIVVESVPFDYAIPVLVGWDMGDNEKEINIKDIGAWIESFEYVRAPGSDSGTLIYTIKSVFLDKGGRFSSIGARDPRYQVNVLGFDASELPAPVGVLEATPIDAPDEPVLSRPAGSLAVGPRR